MKIIITLVLALMNFTLSYSQSAWVSQSTGLTDELRSVYFINENTGWAAGTNGRIIKTTDSGNTWLSQNSNTGLDLNEISFANENTGWAVGGNPENNPLCYDLVIIVKTTDGGMTWLTDMSGHGYIFNDLCVVDENIAFITNKGVTGTQFCIEPAGKVAKTIKEGTTWNSLIDGAGFNSVFFLNSLTGWAVSEYRTDIPPSVYRILRSTNGGTNWATIRTDTSINIASNKKIKFVTGSTGYMIFNSLVRSTDGGSSWSNTDSSATLNINSFYFTDPNTGWAIGSSGKIIKTNNGGTNWTMQASNVSEDLNGIKFINSNVGFVVGDNGTILKTTTGGLNSVADPNTAFSEDYFLYQNYPNPFNPNTIINYKLGNTDFVKLKIYNNLGHEIATLVNDKQAAGNYSIDFNGSNIPSGVYFYTLEIDGNVIYTKRMILMK